MDGSLNIDVKRRKVRQIYINAFLLIIELHAPVVVSGPLIYGRK